MSAKTDTPTTAPRAARKRPRKTRRKARRRATPEDARAAFLLWWASVGGVLDELHMHVERLRDSYDGRESPVREMFACCDLRQLVNDLSEAACQWGACSPRLFPNMPDPLAGLLREGV